MYKKYILPILFLIALVICSALYSSSQDNNESIQTILSFFQGNLSQLAYTITMPLLRAWNYSIYTTTDKQAITLGNILLGLILFVLGLRLARYLTELTKIKVLNIIKLEPNVKNILEKVIHALFIILITLTVLEISHVPLTIFTFIGGALAISLGLGSQHILNNVISGLTIMIEQPIRLGDLLDVGGGNIGRVVNIGPRCVILRTADNIDVLVPNSLILQNTIINYTLNDSIIRISTNIYCMYNTSSQDVESILHSALEQNKDVLKYPRPQILLNSIEGGVLHFVLNFWIDVNGGPDRKQITSNILHSINSLLQQHNIPIAFYHNHNSH
ncbi:Potassium efflux system KefA precursor [Rickettsiales bacterium Ac37b]|nr:Potassium efflux system KefA precursor [Rickettsiales bacterium Ac37b]